MASLTKPQKTNIFFPFLFPPLVKDTRKCVFVHLYQQREKKHRIIDMEYDASRRFIRETTEHTEQISPSLSLFSLLSQLSSYPSFSSS